MSDVVVISNSQQPFTDRAEAGRLLGESLIDLNLRRPVVLGIPRGGIITALEISKVIGGETDIVLARKLRAPFNPELAIGAVTESGASFIDKNLVNSLGVSEDYIEQEKSQELNEINRRLGMIRSFLPKSTLRGRDVVVTDDGVATGSTMQSALQSAREEKPEQLICALPVAPEETATRLADHCDRLVLLRMPITFYAVGQFYLHFDQVDDSQVIDILKHEARDRRSMY